MHILCLHYSIHTKLSVSCIYILCFYLPNLAVLITIFQSQSPSLLPFSKSRGERATLIEIFALKATLCNFKILPDPGRESWGRERRTGNCFWLLCKSFAKQLWLKDKSTSTAVAKREMGQRKQENGGKWQMEICFPFPANPKKKKNKKRKQSK